MMVNIRNPKTNHRGTVDCEIEHPELGWISFTADPDDVEPFGREVYKEVQKMEVAPYEPPPPPPLEEREAEVRRKRDLLLVKTDWTQLQDVPESTAAAYSVYRQALRDVPQQEGFPDDVIWPTKPSSINKGV